MAAHFVMPILRRTPQSNFLILMSYGRYLRCTKVVFMASSFVTHLYLLPTFHSPKNPVSKNQCFDPARPKKNL